MVMFISIALCMTIAVVSVLVGKAYAIAPDYELKRQALQGNKLARQLIKAVEYGRSLHILLWLWLLISTAVAIILLTMATAAWVAALISVVFLWLLFDWLPKIRTGRIAVKLANKLTPFLIWKLQYLDAPLKFASRWFARHAQPKHTGLYELQDLLDLLSLQSQQRDSRITNEEIVLIQNVLQFGDRKVSDIMRPRKQVKSVSITDAIGPVLLDELHASGQTVFPVKNSSRSKEIIASLHIGDVGIHSTGTVQDYATRGTSYINEADSLADALHVFFQTKQQLAVVIDSEQKYIGALTLEDILHTLLGRPAPDEQLGSHDEPEVVAARHDGETVVE